MTIERPLRRRGLTGSPATSPGTLGQPVNLIYQLKITLNDVVPAVWRRIQVPAGITLFRLHEILQRTMPWADSHMHQFIVGRTAYRLTHCGLGMDARSDRSVTLAAVAPTLKRRFIYEYDFGDSWQHEVVVENILPRDPAVHYPICLAGERACPPEDCGGWPGYDSLLEASGHPEHPDYDEMLWWLGEQFDPEAFDLAKISKALARLGRVNL